jgi:hypothetical protein
MPSLAPSLNLLLGGSLSLHQNNDVGAPQLPTKMEAEALFQRYTEAVSPLAHVLHIPSFKRLFDRFWLNIEMGSPNQNSCTALILAVCMAAAASVSPLQAKSQFGITKEDLFLRLQKATERALLRANWAKTSNIRTLQALTIYLVCNLDFVTDCNLADHRRYPCVEHRSHAQHLLWLALLSAWRSVLVYID